MRKLLAILLMLAMLVMSFGAIAESETEETDIYDYEELTVGTVTEMTGYFFTDMWGTNTADIDVRMLLHGYNLVRWQNQTASFGIDTSVASGITATENKNGMRTYTVVLNEDLTYSDGTPINAYDYAFSMLLSLAPEMKAIGADTSGHAYIYGSDAYMAGETKVLAGVRVMSDYMLTVTVKAEYFPFFYELSYLSFNPYPISVIAPGCEVADDGEGVYIRNIAGEDTAEQEEAVFTADLLRSTILDSESGYMSHPSVVSGPYVMTDYNSETHTAEFVRNEYYKGDVDGRVPAIEKLTYTCVTNANMMDKLQSGEVDLINKVVNVNSIDAGMELAQSEEYSVSNYARSGLGMISFCCEQTAVSSKAVRQAIYMCLDKEALISDYVRNYGIAADGYYGMGQWIYQLVNGTISAVPVPEEGADEAAVAEFEAETAKWSELTMDGLTTYAFDVEAAQQLLIDDGWTLNVNGEEFDPANDDVRCKMVEDELVALDLTLVTASPSVAEPLEQIFTQNLAQVGIKLTIETVSTSELFGQYYRESERECDMILFATNFSTVYDPSALYDPADAEIGLTNRSGLVDEALYAAAVDLRETEPGDMLTYCKKWIKFQELWSDALPAIPLYSNVYFDFYSSIVHEYDAAGSMSWTQAIMGSYLGEITVTETADDAEETVQG